MEARGRVQRGRFPQALGRRHAQGGQQHQRHGGPRHPPRCPRATVEPRGRRQSECAAQLAGGGRGFWMRARMRWVTHWSCLQSTRHV